MSTDPVRRVNLAAVTCDPRRQLPDGFRRNSTRVGTLLGAARTGLSVYELPPGQAVGPYHYEDPEEEWLLVVSGTLTAVGAVVYPNSDMIQLFTTDGEDDLVVKRSSAVDVAAPWAIGEAEAKT
jgi:hypothetical protein